MTEAKNTETMRESEVLFQKLGNTWYVFSEIESEIIYSALPEGMDPHSTRLELYEVIEEHMKKVANTRKRRPDVAA